MTTGTPMHKIRFKKGKVEVVSQTVIAKDMDGFRIFWSTRRGYCILDAFLRKHPLRDETMLDSFKQEALVSAETDQRMAKFIEKHRTKMEI